MGHEFNIDLHERAWLSLDQCDRSRAGRASWPIRSRLEARIAVGGFQPEVSIGLGFGGGSVGLAANMARGYTVGMTGYGMAQSSYNIATGNASWGDALAFLPAAGFATKKVASLGGKLLGSRAVKVASSGIDSAPAESLRFIRRGERVANLLEELAQRTWQTGAEHAIVSLTTGGRALVKGGAGGIDFTPFAHVLKRVIVHTHPKTTGPSNVDFRMLEQLGQRSSWIYELFGGGLSKFYRR